MPVLVSQSVGDLIGLKTCSGLDAIISLNIKGVAFGTKHAARAMQKNQLPGGAIVNLASDLSFVAEEGSFSYCMTKGAVAQITRWVPCSFHAYAAEIDKAVRKSHLMMFAGVLLLIWALTTSGDFNHMLEICSWYSSTLFRLKTSFSPVQGHRRMSWPHPDSNGGSNSY